MTRHVAIVGSGFAAWGAALALVQHDDIRISLFDIGLTAAASTAAHRPVPNAKMSDGSYYGYGVNDPDYPVQLDSLRISSSHAFGGYSTVYSGAVLYPKNQDLSGWPESSLPQAEDYAAVVSKIPILHEPDGLDTVFPWPPDSQAISARESAGTKSVAGLSRIAVSQAPNEINENPLRVFSVRDQFSMMIQSGQISYSAGCYVSHASSRDGRVELFYFVNGTMESSSFDAVFLGAGCVNSTAIVDRSVHPPGTREYRIRAPQLAIHAFFRIPWLEKKASTFRRQNGLPEYFLELRSPSAGNGWSHTQLSCVNDQIIDAVCKRLPRFLHPAVRWSRRLVYFALSLKATDGYEMARLRSTTAADDSRQSVCVTEHPSAPEPRLVNAVRLATLRHWRFLRMVPIPFGERLAQLFRGNRLGGWHFGGTLPMRDHPVEPTECWPTGELQGLAGVYVLDSAAFPSIPGSTVALLSMAHGHRVARGWISRIFSRGC